MSSELGQSRFMVVLASLLELMFEELPVPDDDDAAAVVLEGD